MLQGELLKSGWGDQAVKESWTLSSCKGCKSECPTNVDIATYKSEFLLALLRGSTGPLNHYLLVHLIVGRGLPPRT